MENLHAKLLGILLLCVPAGFGLSEVLEISRLGKDSFRIPSSICLQSVDCGAFKASATRRDVCSCKCPTGNATFTFHNKSWKCLENNEVRNLLDCGKRTLFFNKSGADPLRVRVLKIGDSKKLERSNQECSVNVSSSWYIDCRGTRHPLSRNTSNTFAIVQPNRSGYKLKVEVNNVSSTTMLKGRIINLGISCTIQAIGGRNTTEESCILFKLKGTIRCPMEEPSSTASTTFAVLKSSTKPAVVTVQSIAASLVTTFITEPAPAQTTSQPVIHTEIQPTTTVNPQTDFSATVDDPATKEGPLASNRPSSGQDQSEKGDSSSSSSLGLILGVTVSALTLALFIAGVFIYRRRNSSKKRHKRTKAQDANTVTMSPQTNSAFQSDVQAGYESLGYREPAYATMANHNDPNKPADNNPSYQEKNSSLEERPPSDHLYAALNDPEKLPIYGPPQEPVYNSLEEPAEPLSDSTGEYENLSPRHKGPELSNHLYESLNSSKEPHIYGTGRVQEPVYNVLEEPLSDGTGGLEHEKDPLYNILEEPIPDISDGPNSYGPGPVDEPVYNVLEEHFPNCAEVVDGYDSSHEQDPKHNVLESPYSDEKDNAYARNDGPGATDDPVYNTLEGPDPNGLDNQPVYAVVNKKGKRNQGGVPGELS